jgi:pimeloyl-ACP methyl ester carboxylesterase
MDWIHYMHQELLEFDWPSAQEHLNRHAHFLASVPDEETGHTVTIHFTHTRSTSPSAIPLILVHGWPGSVHEFDRVVDALASPSDPSTQAFHVVVPSIPGFLWSSPPPKRGWTMQDTARVFHKLLLELGYEKYVAQAGDWGMFVARELGANPEFNRHCRAVHLNFSPTPLPAHLKNEDLTEREKKVEERCQDWLDEHLGYGVMMRTRPHTLGVSLLDNPLGILLWVGEKYLELVNPEHYSASTSDTEWAEKWEEALLTTVCLYYFSGCMMTSMLPYFENVKHAGFGEFVLAEKNRIKVPMGFMSCRWDSRPGTKRGVERSGDLVYYKGELAVK